MIRCRASAEELPRGQQVRGSQPDRGEEIVPDDGNGDASRGAKRRSTSTSPQRTATIRTVPSQPSPTPKPVTTSLRSAPTGKPGPRQRSFPARGHVHPVSRLPRRHQTPPPWRRSRARRGSLHGYAACRLARNSQHRPILRHKVRRRVRLRGGPDPSLWCCRGLGKSDPRAHERPLPPGFRPPGSRPFLKEWDQANLTDRQQLGQVRPLDQADFFA